MKRYVALLRGINIGGKNKIAMPAKANWWKKTASAGIGEMITIRTANTLIKIVGM